MPRPPTVSTLLGRRLRALRTLRRLTQEKLGERAAMSEKFLGQIERGTANPSLDVLQRLSRALQIELWQLLRFEEPRPEGGFENAARGFEASERLSDFLADRPAAELEKALRVLEVVLGDRPPRPR